MPPNHPEGQDEPGPAHVGRAQEQGILPTARRGEPVDFREQQGVYVLYDESYRLVYAGQAGSGEARLMDRLRKHRTNQLADRWNRFSWFGIRWVRDNGLLSAEAMRSNPEIPDVLNHIEAILIASAEPAHNLQGGRFGEEVEQYLQYYDTKKLGPDIQEMVKTIYKKISNGK